MSRRQISVASAVLIICLAVGGVVVLLQPAAATAPTDSIDDAALGSPTPTAACQSTDGTTVLGIAGGSYYDGNHSLYPGSELQIVVCEGGEPLEYQVDWILSDEERVGYEISDGESGSAGPIITLTGQTVTDISSDVELTTPENDLVFRPPNAHIYTESQLFDGPIRFQSKSDRKSFEDNETTLSNQMAQVESLLAELNESRSALTSNSDPEKIEAHGELLENLSTTRAEIDRTTTNMSILLHEQAMHSIQAENTLAARNTLQQEQNSIDEQVKQSSEASEAELKDIEQTFQWSVRQTLGVGLLIGLLLGFIVGFIGPYRKGREVDDFYQISSQNELTTDVLKLPWIIGALFMAGGIAAMVLFGFLGVIV